MKTMVTTILAMAIFAQFSFMCNLSGENEINIENVIACKDCK